MKSKIITLLLALVLGTSLCACGDGGAESVLEASSGTPEAVSETPEASSETEESSEEDDYSVEVPKAAQNLSEEENALLNGKLKDGVYTNEYFGYKVTAPDGAAFVRLNDDAAETKEPVSISEGYAEGFGGIYYSCNIDEYYTYFSILVAPLKDDETGCSEKELVEKNLESLGEVYKALGDDADLEYGTVVLAGEKHPAILRSSETDKGVQESVDIFIPKDDFELNITVYATDGKLEDVLKCFEKL